MLSAAFTASVLTFSIFSTIVMFSTTFTASVLAVTAASVLTVTPFAVLAVTASSVLASVLAFSDLGVGRPPGERFSRCGQ